MKFFHLSDLHFGKQLQGYDLKEEQREIIKQIMRLVRRERPDAILVAGDIYDRSIPSESAMSLLEEFFAELDEMAQEGVVTELLLIAGNHDSAKRLSYGSTFLKRHHIHISVFPPRREEECMERVVLEDTWGKVNFYMLPYTKAGMLRTMEGGEEIQNAQDAVTYLLKREKIDWNERNVLLSHQFYVQKGRETVLCQSERGSSVVGGLESVDVSIVELFDYVALGHIHSPQNLGSEHIRYCGTPLKYSVSEWKQEKSVTIVEMGEKGEIHYHVEPLIPIREVVDLEGDLEDIIARTSGTVCHDYVRIVLHDEEIVEPVKERLEKYYDHILEIQIDNTRTRKILEEEVGDVQVMSLEETFAAFFLDATGRELNQEEENIILEMIEEVGEEE